MTVHAQYARRHDLVLFSVKDINRIASVVNAVLKKDGTLYGMHITIDLLYPLVLSNVNQRLVIRGRTE